MIRVNLMDRCDFPASDNEQVLCKTPAVAHLFWPRQFRPFQKRNISGLRAESFPSPVVESPRPVRLELLTPLVGQPFSERVMARLAQAEAREVEAHLADDYRIAWLTVLHCAEGIAQPWEFAFWRYLGQHPKKLIPFFVERAEKHAQMIAGTAGEGPAFGTGAVAGPTNAAAPLPPKKPATSIKPDKERAA